MNKFIKCTLGEGNLIFLLYGQWEEFFRVGIICFRLNTSKNKNADHRVKETCAILSIQVTYETYHISLLRDSAMSNALNFRFLCILL